jgi:uncharacterized protein YqeY
MLKQRRESIEQYQKAKRDDLAAKEIKEIAIIEGYLPKAASPEAITEAVDAAIKETGASTMKDMGNLMKAVMAKLAGQTVDGKQVSDLVKSKLSKL